MEQLHPPFSNDDHSRGPRDATVTVIVFGDYECPRSARLWRVVGEMRDARSFREVFRHFPLTAVHPHAMLAAQAAEAAADQGMFWEMHDVLFDRQDALDVPDLATHAAALGLDVERFAEDLAYGTFVEAVRSHQRSGISSGVVTTPAVFVNGKPVALDDPSQLAAVLVGSQGA